ncbi:hypothetical protein PIROE2DRAFT_10348, partial [Piromyces sp. E2]
NNSILFFISLCFIIHQTLGTTTPSIDCECAKVFDSDGTYKSKYCVGGSGANLALYGEQSFGSASDCKDDTSFTTTKSISGVENAEHVFIDSKGDIVSSTSSSTKTVVVAGFTNSSGSFAAITPPADGESNYYLNKYGGGNQIIEVTANANKIVSGNINQEEIEYIFINNKGEIVSSTSSSTKTVIEAGYKFDSDTNSFTAITPPISDGSYYLNKYGGGIQVIEVTSDTYSIMTSDVNQAYYPSGVNAIICTGVNTCELVTASDLAGKFYVNSADTTKIISSYGTVLSTTNVDISKYPYLLFKTSNNDGLIDCSPGNCSIQSVIPRNVMSDSTGVYAAEGYYLGGGYNATPDAIISAIILCTSDYGCNVKYDETTPSHTEDIYFLNAGATKTDTPLISYATESPFFTIVPSADDNVYYINGGDSNNKPLIYCETKTSCEEVKVDENYHYVSFDHNLILYGTENVWKKDSDLAANPGYFLNGGADKYDHPLIYCVGTTAANGGDNCSTIEAVTNGYYIYKNSNSLISCSSEHSCSIIVSAEEGYYINNQADADTKPLIYCSDAACATMEATVGYYLDQSTYNNNKYYGLIYCSSSTVCTSVASSPGFYINASDGDNEIIECQTSCASKPAHSCIEASEKIIIPAGIYCYDNDILQFVFNAFELNDTRTELDEEDIPNYLVSVESDDEAQADYIYTTVDADIFPGITSTISTLFKVSQTSITLVIEDGIVSINTKTNARFVNYAESITLNSKFALYNCDSSIPRCTPINSCSHEMYIYDSTNQKGLYCNGYTLNSITTEGFYLDESRSINKNYPYVLDCDSTGKCTSINPSLNCDATGKCTYSYINTYMLNAGFDKNTKKLITCHAGDCKTIEASIGYYLDYEKQGVIYCTSTVKCSYVAVTNYRYFLNAGVNLSNKHLIYCNSGYCNTITPSVGYYITYSPSILINCVSRSECSEVIVSDGYYPSSYKGYIIHCLNNNNNINCGLESTKPGAYISNTSRVLVLCDENECITTQAAVGTYISARTYSGVKVKRNENGMDLIVPEDEEEGHLQKRDATHNLIVCDMESCRELGISELALIPICTFANNICYITSDYANQMYATTTLMAGGYCTNFERSKLYFATDTIVVESNVIGSTSSTYTHTTTVTNCLEVSKAYKNYYYTSGSNIYHLDDNRITLMVDIGYYFININENTLATGRNIEEYNNPSTKIYKCNGQLCTIIDKLYTDAYFVDVNKKIIKYNAEAQNFSFPYNKDIICIYENNQCTPKYDLIKQEFCITYMGELVLATRNILSRESAPCYRSKDIDTNIYGYSEYLYRMDKYSAVMVDRTSYHIITKSTNFTAQYMDYTNKPQSIIVYGCIKNSCDVYTPLEKIYYYDSSTHFMYRLVNGVWEAPEKSGYAYISISPNELYIYKFSIKNGEIILESRVTTGFYYTVDKEMYECSNTDCQPISDSGYVFTNNGQIYYCEYDSEELEDTVCKIQSCVTGQYYYIDGYYYRCESGSNLNLMNSKNCVYSSRYVINFPTILSDDYPSKVRYAVDKIAKNNHSTATSKKGRNYLPVVPAVFTNCTYNFEDHEATFDLVCVSNYVTLNYVKEPEICSVSNMGYVYCADDSDNPNKCNPSAAHRTIKISFTILLLTVLTTFIFIHL